MTINTPNKAQLPALRSLWKEAFGDTEQFLDTFFTTAFSPDRCLVANKEGRIAAALYWFDCRFHNRPVAYLYAVATAKDLRRQGVCRRLMEETHRRLAQSGYHGTVLVPGNAELFRFYERMGYLTCCYIKELRLASSSSGSPQAGENRTVSFRQTDTASYAALRRRFLPDGSILQENENLCFLETQASFYHGDDFLLAARKEGTRLFGTELLGNPEKMPELLADLGCTEGVFRTPGTERAFAMYRPLTAAKKVKDLPDYFGFAFD